MANTPLKTNKTRSNSSCDSKGHWGSGIRNLWLMLSRGKLSLAIVRENLFLRLPMTKSGHYIWFWQEGGSLECQLQKWCMPLENEDILKKMLINVQFVPEISEALSFIFSVYFLFL